MTTVAIPRVRTAPESVPQVTHLEEVAETIRDDALALAREKVHHLQQCDDVRVLLARPAFVESFKYGLALGVARTLAAADPQTLAVYAYDPSANPEGEYAEELPLDATLHLLALVKRPSAALAAFLAALDGALTAALKELPTPAPWARRESVLDVNLVTEKDVRLGLGFAGMLSSVYAPPLKVWERQG